VFSGSDIKRSIDEGYEEITYYPLEGATPIEPDQGIPRFAAQMKEKYNIGCLVEFTNGLTSCSLDYEGVATKTKNSCKDLWDMSSVIIWQFSIHLGNELNHGLNFRFQMCEVKYNLLQILSERDEFLKLNPEKEVILQIVIPNVDEEIQNQKRYYHNNDPKDLMCNNYIVKELQEFYNGIQTWAGIHGMKVILSPAFDAEDQEKGLWLQPKEDGSPSMFSMDDCQSYNQRGNRTYH
jgi:hypothetical protein